jgi:hypothetical protein
MPELGKMLVTVGVFLVIIGGLLLVAGKTGILGQLPGDFVIKKKNVTIIFPLATSILLSIVLSLIFYLTGFFKK